MKDVKFRVPSEALDGCFTERRYNRSYSAVLAMARGTTQRCPKCKGKGGLIHHDFTGFEDCPACDGIGIIPAPFDLEGECPICQRKTGRDGPCLYCSYWLVAMEVPWPYPPPPEEERPPREMTTDEVRARFLEAVARRLAFWRKEKQIPMAGRMRGLVTAILRILDGREHGLPAFLVAPNPSLDDCVNRRKDGADWFPLLTREVVDKGVVKASGNIAGPLAERWAITCCHEEMRGKAARPQEKPESSTFQASLSEARKKKDGR